MVIHGSRAKLFATTFFAAAAMIAATPQAAAAAAAAPNPDATDTTSKQVDEVVVTGSRIKQSQADVAAPTAVVDTQMITDRGYVQAGDALNAMTANAPQFTSTAGSGTASGNGQQYPNLFNLGAGRTLTLVDGIRMTSTASGNGDLMVDTNIIPIGLLDRIELVEATGAAVYGSDAIAGVVNYVLKNNFQGLQADFQGGETSYGDYPKYSASVVFGKNFLDGRGNIAVDVEWRKTGSLLFTDRPWVLNTPRSTSNPYDTGPNDGISASIPVYNPYFWTRATNGNLFTSSSTASITGLLGYQNPGHPTGFQFAPNGQSIIPFNPGAQPAPPFNCGANFCSGGDGVPYYALTALATGVETQSAFTKAHYDITDHMTASAQLLVARTEGTDPYGSQVSSTVLGFNKTNPYLTAADIAQLSALSSTFANGGNLFVSKYFGLPDGEDELKGNREYTYRDDSIRAVVGLTGDFNALDRPFDYTATYAHSDARNTNNATGLSSSRLSRATNVTTNSAGQIVCSINAVTVVDPACTPLNVFGAGAVSPATSAYLTLPADVSGRNTEDDLITTIGGTVFKAPAGPVKFSLGYEHRFENAQSTPSTALQSGLLGSISVPTYGSYHTNEYSGELLAPIIGPEFNLGQDIITKIELNGQYRVVDNSLAGVENVWGYGGVLETMGGLSFRAGHSRNFRAPTLNELISPVIVSLGGTVSDPCDTRFVNTGTAPATRAANCLALFQANPTWGLSGIGLLAAGASANARLANFSDPAVNCTNCVNTTSGGNPNLQNEVATNTTYGFTWRPRYVPGALSLSVDWIAVDIANGLTAFTGTNFAQACFDSVSMPADVCSTFKRDPTTGFISDATSTTFNAASVTYRGELYRIDYTFPLSWVAPNHADAGRLNLDLEATHNETLNTVVAGTLTRQAGTTVEPWWVIRGDLHYMVGDLRFNYELYYLSDGKINRFDTPESTYDPHIKDNIQQSISATYDFGKGYEIRAGVENLTDQRPSFPTFNYGNPYGRQIFVGLRIRE
jgi:iron complex outermembrane recepter protein